jgi:three-Cys-motif partner protein
MPKNFIWSPGNPLPRIEPHSDRKLEVLEKYLDVYFDTVVPNPATDCLNITLVDGFCGGGAYIGKDTLRFGSPLILLRAVESAEARLNARREKPLRINARFIFVDDNQDHIEALREQLIAQGYKDKIGNGVELICGKFDEQLNGILATIKASQRAGRSIFILGHRLISAQPDAD